MSKVEKVIVMGVSGCGKTAVGQALAQKLKLPFVDADSLHSAANVAKMASGQPLNDVDRADWLTALANLITRNKQLVLACSALKRQYRDQLRAADPTLTFLYLHGSYETISSRMRARDDHYFSGEDMLKSQFRQLEEPVGEQVLHISVEQNLDAVITTAITALGVDPQNL